MKRHGVGLLGPEDDHIRVGGDHLLRERGEVGRLGRVDLVRGRPDPAGLEQRLGLVDLGWVKGSSSVE